jgi:hypothetical protein
LNRRQGAEMEKTNANSVDFALLDRNVGLQTDRSHVQQRNRSGWFLAPRARTTNVPAIMRRGPLLFDVGESRILRYAPQGPFAPGVHLSLRHELVTHSDAGVQRRLRPCALTGRAGLNGPQTDHLGPAAQARHYRYDVDGIHVMRDHGPRPKAASKSRFSRLWWRRH